MTPKVVKSTSNESEPERKNGYYWHKPSKRHFVSVTTFGKSLGNAGGLINWAAKAGAAGVGHGLLSISRKEEALARMDTPNFVEWAKEEGLAGLRAEQGRVSGIGNRAHAAFEKMLRDESTGPLDPDVLDIANTLFIFVQEVAFKTPNTEEAVFYEAPDIRGCFAGRFDALMDLHEESLHKMAPFLAKNSASLQPGNCVVDLKTGTVYPNEVRTQLAAYRKAILQQIPPNEELALHGLIINVHREEPDKVKLWFFPDAELEEEYHEVVVPGLKIWWAKDAPEWYKKQSTK